LPDPAQAINYRFESPWSMAACCDFVSFTARLPACGPRVLKDLQDCGEGPLIDVDKSLQQVYPIDCLGFRVIGHEV
jgi:hypothetical protein